MPNNANQSNFSATDAVAADAKGHKVGSWDFVANGGNGRYISGTSPSAAAGSNGSVFGDGFRSTGSKPSSCGGPGTDSTRGPLAMGSKITGWSLISNVLKKYITETLPSANWVDDKGGDGGFKLNVSSSGFITLSNGVPVSVTQGDIFTCKGGSTPHGAATNPGQYATIVAFIEYF